MSAERPPVSPNPLRLDQDLGIAVRGIKRLGIPQTLLPEAFKEYRRSLTFLGVLNRGSLVGEFALQVYAGGDNRELSQPETINWMALRCTFAIQDEGVVAQRQNIIQPTANEELHEMAGYEDMFTHTITLEDINWRALLLATSAAMPDTAS